MLLETYQKWFELLAEYENLLMPDNPEWIKYRQTMARLANLNHDETKNYLSNRLTPEITNKLMAVDSSSAELTRFENIVNKVRAEGLVLETQFSALLKHFIWKDVVTKDLSLVTIIDLSTKKIDKVSRIRKLTKKCKSLGFNITKEITDDLCYVYANVQSEYAPIVKHINLKEE